MAKVTGKLQITIPKRLADAHGIGVGDDVEFVAVGGRIMIIPAHAVATEITTEERLRHFDAATRRQEVRERSQSRPGATSRGWTREELYTRGRTR